MKKRLWIGTLCILVGVGMFVRLLLSADASRMTKDELKALLENPDLVVVDVRLGKDWTGSDLKIKGAVREGPKEVNAWSKKYSRDRIIVLYCA